MDQDTIAKLAKAHATLICSYSGASQQDALGIASSILMLISAGMTYTPVAPISSTLAHQGKEFLPVTDSPGQPQTPSSVAEQSGEGPVLARPGYHCFCDGCHTAIYEVTAPIYGKNMGVNALLRAIKPLNDVRPLTREDLDVFKDKEGNTRIDCPSCNGTKTLILIGSSNPKVDAVKRSVVGDVTSFSAGELGVQ